MHYDSTCICSFVTHQQVDLLIIGLDIDAAAVSHNINSFICSQMFSLMVSEKMADV